MITPGTASHNRNCGVSPPGTASHKKNCELRRLTKESTANCDISQKELRRWTARLTKRSRRTGVSQNEFLRTRVTQKELIELASHKRKSSNSASHKWTALKRKYRIFENRIQENQNIKMWRKNWKIWEAGRISKESGLRTSFSRIWPRKVASSKRGINNQKAVSYTSKSSLLSVSYLI